MAAFNPASLRVCSAWPAVQAALKGAQLRQPADRLLSGVDAVVAAGAAAALAEELLHLADAATAGHIASLCTTAAHAGVEALQSALDELCAGVGSIRAFLAAVRAQVLQPQPHQLSPLDRVTWLGLEQVYARRIAALLLAEAVIPAWVHSFFAGKLRQLSEAAQAEGADSGMARSRCAEVQEVAASLRALGLEILIQEACSAVVCDHLREELFQSASGGFEESILEQALEYSSTVPLQFLTLVLPEGLLGAPALQEWRARLGYFVFEVVGSKRMADLFDIVVDFPDSLPAVHDLQECLRNTNLHSKLIRVFGKAIQARLLHPGAATTDIIQQYISTIKALQQIDPSGVILDAVGDPIREYLRSRKDTIRCIVTMLTDDGEDAPASSLLAELGTVELGIENVDADFEASNADEQALEEAERWEPDPVEADVSHRTGSQATSDVLNMLVGIYGSRELFITEYRSMLSDRLLAKTDYDCDRELRTLELLKVRFGEATLHNAEIMLKDLADSKRINTNVKSVPDTATPVKHRPNLVGIQHVDATIVSELFWPQLPQEEFVLPSQIRAILDTYGAKFHSLKAPRKLEWKPNLGTVTLELSIGSQDLEFAVSPLHASIILHFQRHLSWRAGELAAALGLQPDVLRKKILYWINQGVISESRAGTEVVYRRNEELVSTGAVAEGEMDIEDGGEQDDNQQMSKYEPFIMGMLTNFDSMPLDRIHNMLKMFVSDPPYDKTTEQLGAYLSTLVTYEKISLSGGVYKKR